MPGPVLLEDRSPGARGIHTPVAEASMVSEYLRIAEPGSSDVGFNIRFPRLRLKRSLEPPLGLPCDAGKLWMSFTGKMRRHLTLTS